VRRAVACRTVDPFLSHLAFKVLLNHAGRHLFVTLNAGALLRRGKNGSAEEQNKTEYEQNPDTLHKLCFLLLVKLFQTNLLSTDGCCKMVQFKAPECTRCFQHTYVV
jgi:hypothetical protein